MGTFLCVGVHVCVGGLDVHEEWMLVVVRSIRFLVCDEW